MRGRETEAPTRQGTTAIPGSVQRKAIFGEADQRRIALYKVGTDDGWLRDQSNQNKSVESKWKIQLALQELEPLKADNGRILKLISSEKKSFTG